MFMLFFNISSLCHLVALLRVPHLMLSEHLQLVLEEVIPIEKKNKQFFASLPCTPPPHPPAP